MKVRGQTRARFFVFITTVLAGLYGWADVHYVDANNPNPSPPYLTWATAATNIQDAIFRGVSGDTVLVTNGVYQYGGYASSGSNRVYLINNVTVKSVNGPAYTAIVGYQVPGSTNGNDAVRCACLSSGTTLSGFTLRSGATRMDFNQGAGVYCQSLTAVVTNCVFTGNVAASDGGGAFSGTLVSCVLSNNHAGGLNLGTGGGASHSVLVNCLVKANYAGYIAGGAFASTLVNCTVVSNTAVSYAGSTSGCVVKNSIVYYNANEGGSGPYVTNCCISYPPPFGATNVFTNAPLFVDPSNDNFRLNPGSPCLGAGDNAFVTYSTDLEGNPRVVAGTVDLGAYEFQSPVRYVNLSNATPLSPFTNWVTAATDIQDAIDVASAGDMIVVSNGVYQSGGRVVFGTMTNRVVIDKALTVQSVNGAGATIIAGVPGTGGYYSQGMRCVYLTNGAALVGFTLTNGATRSGGNLTNEQSGGAAWCESTNALLTDCVLTYSYANQNGGAIYQGTLNHCAISNSTAFMSGGGAYQAGLNNCLVLSNRLIQGSGGGGAAYGTLSNCLVVANFVPGYGGGSYYATVNNCTFSNNIGGFGGAVSFGEINNSLISSNTARYSGYGGGAFSNLLRNCVIKNNVTSGSGNGAYNSIVVNCTVVSNTSPLGYGAGGGLYGGSASNSIIYYNFAGKIPEVSDTLPMYYCCSPVSTVNGVGNITNAPRFVAPDGGDYHLQANSPCINAGNNAYVTSLLDLESKPRVRGGTVDMGAYEFQNPGSTVSYAWLQQYGLPTDGSADSADPDQDGLNTWQEWICGTDPTNAASVLALLTPSNSLSGITLTWQTVAGKIYYVQRSANLAAVPAFSTIRSNLAGQAGRTSFIDTSAAGGGPYFYRVGVQP